MIIKICVKDQLLILENAGEIVSCYTISTAKNGVGEENGSGMTPRGWHQIRLKIGSDCPSNTVFERRRPTGEIYTPRLAEEYPQRDWILTRILWLSGLEPGINRFGNNDTLKRYIYIHGCPDEVDLGIPQSHGCIRMRNADIITLFDMVAPGMRVLIT